MFGEDGDIIQDFIQIQKDDNSEEVRPTKGFLKEVVCTYSFEYINK